MPLSVCIAKASIMNWVPGSHASTYGGNPICLAAALATIEIIEREAMGNAATVGAAALSRLQSWVDRHESVGDVRGRGLMIGVEIVGDKRTKSFAGAARDRIVDLAFERGLLLLGCGESTIRLCPALVVTQDEMGCGARYSGRVRDAGGSGKGTTMTKKNALWQMLEQVAGRARAAWLFDVLAVPDALLEENGEKVSRAAIAQALNMLLFEDLVNRVPDAKRYADDCVRG